MCPFTVYISILINESSVWVFVDDKHYNDRVYWRNFWHEDSPYEAVIHILPKSKKKKQHIKETKTTTKEKERKKKKIEKKIEKEKQKIDKRKNLKEYRKKQKKKTNKKKRTK